MSADPDQSLWLDGPDDAVPGRIKSLLVSIGFLLSIAILPIGMIAVSQVNKAEERTKASYLDELESQAVRAPSPSAMRSWGLSAWSRDWPMPWRFSIRRASAVPKSWSRASRRSRTRSSWVFSATAVKPLATA